MKHLTPTRTLVEGTVIELFPDDDYGVILTQDQNEVRFHPNDMANKSFAGLRVGCPVRFVPTPTRRGELRA
ncbi:MAG TPA: hypothetical protein VHM70_11060 [Polyangiaceae bacterium]|nr:hypothetical protein [Polyangiaceae bacterium]